MEEIELHSTLDQLKTFINSAVWNDIRQEVQVWLDDIRNQLERENNIEIYRRLQGNAEACRSFLALPGILISTLEEDYGRTDRLRASRNNGGDNL